jgi:transcriptional regulator with XRE-family HTH domain
MKKKPDKENKNTLAYRVIKIRNALNIKGKDLASRLKISQPCLSEIENGKHPPNFNFIYNIYNEFHVNLYYLLYGEGDMFEERGGPLSQRLDRLCKQNKDICRLLEYFERSTIIRYYLLSQFNGKMLLDKELIEKEIQASNMEGQ